MRQALHIFKKDIRYLRWELAAVLAFLVMFVFTETRSILTNRYVPVSLLLSGLWAFLCARLIQAETIPGDRQFWITRPYEWRSLLGAKLLFVVTFVSIPLMVADAVILGIQGFSMAAHIPGLLWSAVLITAGMLLTFCAFATLTRGLTQWLLATLVIAGVIEALGLAGKGNMWGGAEWMRDLGNNAMLFVTALAVLLGQYKWRKTAVSIGVMVLGVAGSWIYSNYAPMDAALAMETRFSKPKTDLSSIQIAVHVPAEPPATRRKQYRSPERQQVVALSIPMDVSGLGEGQDLVSDEVHFTITNENGEGWGPKGNRKDYLEHVPNGYRLTPLVDRVVFEKAKGHPVHLSLRLYLTMLGNPVSTVLRPGTGAANVSGVGRCRYFVDDSGNAIVCESPLRATSNLLQVRFGEERWGQFVGGASYSPFPADSSISPLRGFYHSGSPDFAPATLTSLEPLAHFRRDINLTSVNLADYQISASARF